MKNFLCMLFAFVFVCLPVSLVATAEGHDHDYAEGEISFDFDDPDLSEEMKARIIAHLLGLENDDPEGDDMDNVLCTLFGHKLSSHFSTVTTHKVRSTAPRCLQKVYEVTVCSRCDYTTSQLISTTYVYCCS